MATVFSHWLLMAMVNILHPFYVAVTEMNYNATEKNMEISCKLFIDDFEKALATQYKTKVDLSHPKDKAQTDKMIFSYLQQHLLIKADNKPLSLQYIGYEKEGEAAWCYLQSSQLPQPRTLSINANMLYELFETQMHIIHATISNKRQSAKITAPQSSIILNFN
ncbi:DUF6702 family protein [Filimonas effusa]|uniref:Orphan protein n=1 Tax=Filimonas effusa TaxID=2508721 RepID=A0A4Q1DCT2_9BACT|nr:DUF6702 family protein [Filimonas effusa]RXK86443.1 hypothetical protein ESB13_06450 [Filimonas effusa]